MFLIREFAWCKQYGLDFIDVRISDNAITIRYSYKIKKKPHMLEVINWIRKYTDNPIIQQNNMLLISEWKSHNLLHWLNIERDRTKHCDLDINPLSKKILYVLASLFYWGQ